MGREKPPSLAFLIQSFLGGLALDSRLRWYRTYSLALRHLPLIVFHILGVKATWSEEQPYVFDLVQSAWLWCSWFYLYKQWGQFEVGTIPELTVWLALPSNCPQSGFPSPFSLPVSPLLTALTLVSFHPVPTLAQRKPPLFTTSAFSPA